MIKFKINGIHNKTIFISLKRIAKAFDFEYEIVDEDFTHEIDIQIRVEPSKSVVQVHLQCGEYSFVDQQAILIEESVDTKYCILGCFYYLLSKMTDKHLSYGVLTGIRPTKLVHFYYKKQYTYNEIHQILCDKYKVSSEKAELLIAIVKRQRATFLDFDELHKEVSVYINIPFCPSRCSYCSFTSYPTDYRFVSRREYVATLCEEITILGNALKQKNRNITTIYIGGGTPTALDCNELNQLLTCIEIHLVSHSLREYTLESGRPDSLSQEKFELIRNFSITRMSLNPQTFKEQTLEVVNRKHTINEFLQRYREARDLGYSHINMDLIFGLPNESSRDIMASVHKTIELQPESITIHSLAIKKGSTLQQENFNITNTISDVFSESYSLLQENSYYPYYLYRQKNITGNLENIGFAKKNYESLYNIIMIEEIQTIIGLGCHSSSKYLNKELIISPKDLISYVKTAKDYMNRKIAMIDNHLNLEVDSDE